MTQSSNPSNPNWPPYSLVIGQLPSSQLPVVDHSRNLGGRPSCGVSDGWEGQDGGYFPLKYPRPSLALALPSSASQPCRPMHQRAIICSPSLLDCVLVSHDDSCSPSRRADADCAENKPHSTTCAGSCRFCTIIRPQLIQFGTW